MWMGVENDCLAMALIYSFSLLAFSKTNLTISISPVLHASKIGKNVYPFPTVTDIEKSAP